MKKNLLQRSWYVVVVLLTTLFSLSANAQTSQTFTSSGSWTCPVGVTSVFIETWGGGGAGGGISGAAGAAGGGGGGGYTKNFMTVVPNTSYNFIVGTGGIAGTGVGGDGGASSFDGKFTANGGTGGGTGPSGAAGVGGTGADYNGGNGFAGTSGTRAGAGGGGAGSSANGGNAANTTGGTGGTGGGGAGGAGRTTTGGGAAGTTVGGGGGGAYASGASTQTGGGGAAGQVRITYCNATVTNIATVTGTSFNWSTAAGWSLGRVPQQCDNVEINVTRAAVTNETVTITIPANIAVQNLTIRNLSTSIYQVLVAANVATSTAINIYGNLTIETVGGAVTGNRNNRTSFNCSNSTVNVYGDIILGRPTATSSVAREGHATISGNPTTWNLYGDMIFNPRGYNTNQGSIYNLNSGGTQYLINNTNPSVYNDTIKGNRFQTLNIGNTTPTTVILSGTRNDFSISTVIAGDLNVGVNSTLDIPKDYSFNIVTPNGATTSTLRLAAGARLRLGGDQSLVTADGSNWGVTGSNFPGGYDVYSLAPTSTVEYYGDNGITQTIYNAVTYGNILALNGSGSGRAVKQTTAGTLNIAGSFNINALTDVYLGTSTGLGTSTAPVSIAGPLNVRSTAGLYCNANVISGAGAFTMEANTTLGIGHAQGISNSGSATGNIQMTGGRTYVASGNYLYNGTVAQITGNGLIASGINDLTINNPTTVTIAANQTVNGVTHLQQGVFDIGSTRFTSNGSGTITSTTGKMKANAGLLEMKGNTGVAQNLSGNWFVNKNISTLINANTKGITIASAPSDTLLISSALVYGAGITNSTITTNDNLTLLSRDTATANFGQIATGSGNTITGKVNVERYLYAKKAWRLLATPVSIATSPTITASWREGGPTTSTGYGTQISGPASFVGMDQVTQRASMKYYDAASNSYIDVTNANTAKIANKEGYYVFVRGDRSINTTGATGATNLRIKGDLLTGTQSFTVPANKFYSFGNPYASRIDFRTVSKSNIANAFIVWNPNNAGAYNAGAFETYTWNGTNYVKAGGVIRNFIESGEAIFVQSNTGTAGTVTVNESDKGSGSSLQSRMTTTATAPQEAASTETGRPGVTFPTLEINLYAKDIDGSEYLADGVLLNFANNFSAGVDNMDVRKILNTADNLAIKNGTYNLVVERRPHLTVNDTIPLMVSGLRVAPYRFNIDPSVLQYPGLRAVLKDNFTGVDKTLSLTSVTDVSFDVTSNPQS
ncbi:beta strand repeat-containing protein, partial [Ferruginibacter yonginensis]